jgi:hypothetical protein
MNIRLNIFFWPLIMVIILGSCINDNRIRHFSDLTWKELSQITIETFDDYTLQIVGEMKIPIDSLTPNPIIYPVYFDGDSNHFFSFYNRNTNSLDIYNLGTAKRIKKHFFPVEGPLAISRVSYPFIKSMDSIFIWTLSPPMIILMDSTGHQKKSFNFPEDPQKLNVNMVQHFYEVGNKIVLGYLPYGNSTKLKDSANFLLYDLKSAKVIKSKAGRPRSVSEFPLYGSHAVPRLCVGHNQNIINFFGAGQLIIQSDLKKDTVSYYVLRSKYLPNSYPEPKHDGTVVENRDALKGHYFMMVYDPYRYFYYLMCLLDADSYDQNGKVNGVDDMQISIIIADTLFRRRGELLLPKHKYFRSMFVTKEGLLVSNGNSKNRMYHEDTLTYTIFKPILSGL